MMVHLSGAMQGNGGLVLLIELYLKNLYQLECSFLANIIEAGRILMHSGTQQNQTIDVIQALSLCIVCVMSCPRISESCPLAVVSCTLAGGRPGNAFMYVYKYIYSGRYMYIAIYS